MYGVSISPDGRWIASASVDGAVHLWDAASGIRSTTFLCEGAATCCAFGDDGVLLAGDDDGRVYFMRVEV